MRKAHLAVGLLGIAIFLSTGLNLRWHVPAMAELEPSTRCLLRSRHVYILLASLINVALAINFSAAAGRWQLVQLVGSACLLVAPLLMLMAFCLQAEPANLSGRLAPNGAKLLLAGVVLQLVAAWGSRESSRVIATPFLLVNRPVDE